MPGGGCKACPRRVGLIPPDVMQPWLWVGSGGEAAALLGGMDRVSPADVLKCGTTLDAAAVHA